MALIVPVLFFNLNGDYSYYGASLLKTILLHFFVDISDILEKVKCQDLSLQNKCLMLSFIHKSKFSLKFLGIFLYFLFTAAIMLVLLYELVF